MDEQKPMYKDGKTIFFFILFLVLGIFVGQIIGYSRAWNFYTQSNSYPIIGVIANTDGNTTSLKDVNLPYACATFPDGESAVNFYKEVLYNSMFKKIVCFAGE